MGWVGAPAGVKILVKSSRRGSGKGLIFVQLILATSNAPLRRTNAKPRRRAGRGRRPKLGRWWAARRGRAGRIARARTADGLARRCRGWALRPDGLVGGQQPWPGRSAGQRPAAPLLPAGRPPPEGCAAAVRGCASSAQGRARMVSIGVSMRGLVMRFL